MNERLMRQAEELASKPYIDSVVLDETTDGEPIYLAFTPELEGCMAQGETIDKAVENLQEARADYIYSLLEDNLAVPEPRSTTRTTVSVSSTFLIRVTTAEVKQPWEIVERTSLDVEPNRIIGASFPI
jgi:predicted RNase H-like HicB family nuclease